MRALLQGGAAFLLHHNQPNALPHQSGGYHHWLAFTFTCDQQAANWLWNQLEHTVWPSEGNSGTWDRPPILYTQDNQAVKMTQNRKDKIYVPKPFHVQHQTVSNDDAGAWVPERRQNSSHCMTVIWSYECSVRYLLVLSQHHLRSAMRTPRMNSDRREVLPNRTVHLYTPPAGHPLPGAPPVMSGTICRCPEGHLHCPSTLERWHGTLPRCFLEQHTATSKACHSIPP